MAKSATKNGTASRDTEKVVLEELSFDQMRALEEARRKEEEARILEEAEKIRQAREEEAAKGKKKVVEKISLDEVHTVIEEKKPGLPERIKRLPKNHPERILYEKGFKAKQHKDWQRAAPRQRRTAHAIDKWVLIELFVFVFAVGFLYYGAFQYVAMIDDVREEIVKVLKHKRYTLNDPKISDDFKHLHNINWLPELESKLNFAKSLEFNFSTLEDNPEEGTYLDYIKRHNKTFDERDAMAWRIREVRKPKKTKEQNQTQNQVQDQSQITIIP
ncbi:MAG: hypothetical protein HQL84_16730 [Magnetococcales bacterium]|nr:hypothetical protein [Magnetococcales bacterium]MBF0151667.1 hypothetical protein [Magnetococcales bacterium]MBF0173748.1 hypothetical protein [Magnetococcales bacterium]MBF0347711.1 hypothetical protein [Magnetococcales bacterium]MBF0630616.1 hypothetical protein [Magnetococcales bacterium]